jgi:ribosomal protein S27AE
VRVYTAEELAGMTVDEVNAVIANDLHVDAYESQLAKPKRYKGKGLAEKMENFVFLCPECGEVDTLKSGGDRVTCTHCGLTFRYTEYGMLEGVPFPTMRELARWQEEEVMRAAENGAVYTAESGTLAKIAKHEETPVDSGPIRLSASSLICGNTEIPLGDIANMTMHGSRAIVFSVPGAYYELIPAEGFNTLKFEMLYYCYKNMSSVPVSVS